MNNIEYKKKTGNIYSSLFDDYSEKLFEDSVDLFLVRHKKWCVDLDWFAGKVCLDAGCGGGRFVVALANLGAKEVCGIDIDKKIIEIAEQRINNRNLKQAKVQEASVLDIPFSKQHFDYVISSGVIHHTPDPYKAFLELVRVLKPGGKLFLSVYGKYGLKWLANDIFRYSICKMVPFKFLENIFKVFGVPANKRYNILDNLYVPYCYRFKESEIMTWLNKAGFENMQRVKFERYDYKKFISRLIHGHGWIQIYADKK